VATRGGAAGVTTGFGGTGAGAMLAGGGGGAGADVTLAGGGGGTIGFVTLAFPAGSMVVFGGAGIDGGGGGGTGALGAAILGGGGGAAGALGAAILGGGGATGLGATTGFLAGPLGGVCFSGDNLVRLTVLFGLARVVDRRFAFGGRSVIRSGSALLLRGTTIGNCGCRA
jgi:hypothetical protein